MNTKNCKERRPPESFFSRRDTSGAEQQRRNLTARSVWSARSLLPLSGARHNSKAPASWTHSKPFVRQATVKSSQAASKLGCCRAQIVFRFCFPALFGLFAVGWPAGVVQPPSQVPGVETSVANAVASGHSSQVAAA